MKIEIKSDGVWYHGSNVLFSELRTNSTITQWKELAEAFSHQPSALGYDDNGIISHNGAAKGYLYIIDEPVDIQDDICPHPKTTMDENAEFLTKRPLKVKMICELGSPVERTAVISRKTNETDITVTLNLDGKGISHVCTGIGFFDHMLEGFAKHGFFDLECRADGDLHVDGHHTVEDAGIVLGQAIAQALRDKKGIRRYGFFILPMDDALALCAVDLCGRPYLNFECSFPAPCVGDLDTELVREFFYAVSYSAGMNLHLKMLAGSNSHHMIEAMFKAFAKALDQAAGMDARVEDVLSTKGSL